MDEDGRRRLKDCNHKSSFLLTTIEDYGLWAVILWWWFIASIIVRLYGGVARVINTLARRRARNRFDSARAAAFRGTYAPRMDRGDVAAGPRIVPRRIRGGVSGRGSSRDGFAAAPRRRGPGKWIVPRRIASPLAEPQIVQSRVRGAAAAGPRIVPRRAAARPRIVPRDESRQRNAINPPTGAAPHEVL